MDTIRTRAEVAFRRVSASPSPSTFAFGCAARARICRTDSIDIESGARSFAGR